MNKTTNARARQSDLETHLSRVLETSLRRSQALSTESLCLIAGQKVWSLRADVHVLDHDGGLIDACCLATLAALRHYRIPDTSVHGGELTVYSILERDPGTLSVPNSPAAKAFERRSGAALAISSLHHNTRP